MVLNRTWNNTSYPLPQSGERGWAALTNFLVALADNAQTTGKQFLGRRTATVTPVTITATTDCFVGVNVAGAAAAVNLPAGVNGQVFIIADESGAASTYNITITPNGTNTINGTTSYVMALDKQVTYIIFNSGNWAILSTSTATVPITGVTDSSTIDFTLLAGVLTAIVIDNSLTDAKINSAAAISRSKIAAGTVAHVVYNDGATGALSSEAQLNKTRGGTGVSSTATFPTSGVVVTEAATETLTNKTLTGNTLANFLSGTSALITAPDGPDTLVGKATTDDLTNKSFNGTTVIKAANAFRFNNSGNTFYTGLKGGAAASSGDFILPITDGSAGQAMTTDGSRQLGFSTVATTVGAVAANDSAVVFTNTDNRHQICLPTAARTYTLPTTSISQGDTWDFDNQSLFLITVNSSGGNLVGYIYPKSSSRFIALVATPTTAANWQKRYGSSDTQTYTPTITGMGTVSANSANWQIVGDVLKIWGFYTSGTSAASLFSVSLPSGLSISSSKLPVSSSTAASGALIGFLVSNETGNSVFQPNSLLANTGTSTTVIYAGPGTNTANHLIPKNGNAVASNGENMSYKFEVPLV